MAEPFCNMGEFWVRLNNLSRSEKGADLTDAEVAARIRHALTEEFGLEMSDDVEAEVDEDWADWVAEHQRKPASG